MRRLKIFLINGLLLTVTSFLMRFVAFSFNIYISQKVGAEALGAFSLIMSVYMFFITLATSGINIAVTRIVVEKTTFLEHADTRIAMRKCFLYSFVFGILACLILCIFSKPITDLFVKSSIPNYIFYFIGISLPFISMSSCLNGYFTALRKNGKNATSRIFEQTLKMIATSYFLSLFMPGRSFLCLLIFSIRRNDFRNWFFFIYFYFI